MRISRHGVSDFFQTCHCEFRGTRGEAIRFLVRQASRLSEHDARDARAVKCQVVARVAGSSYSSQ